MCRSQSRKDIESRNPTLLALRAIIRESSEQLIEQLVEQFSELHIQINDSVREANEHKDSAKFDSTCFVSSHTTCRDACWRLLLIVIGGLEIMIQFKQSTKGKPATNCATTTHGDNGSRDN